MRKGKKIMNIYILTEEDHFGIGVHIRGVFTSYETARQAWKESGGSRYGYDIEEHKVIE